MQKGYFYALISILLWSTTATVTKLLLKDITSIQVLLVASFFAFVFLFVVNLLKGNLKELKSYKAVDYLKIFGIGILGTFLYNILLYLGIESLPASQAFTLNYLWPVMIIVFAWPILKEKLTVRKLFAITLSFLGVVIVATDGNLLGLNKTNLFGIFCCIGAAISYGLFSVLNKKENYNKFLSMMLFYLVAFVLSLIVNLVQNSLFVPDLPQLLGLSWIGIFTSAIAFTSWILALNNGNTAKISNLAYITPFLSLIWTILILKEKFSAFYLIGLFLIVLGILIQNIKPKRLHD